MGQKIATMKPATPSTKYTELKKFFEKESSHKKRLVAIMTKVSSQFTALQKQQKTALDEQNTTLVRTLQEDRTKLQRKFDAAQNRSKTLDKSIQKTFIDLGKIAKANKDEIKAVIADIDKKAPVPKKVKLKRTSRHKDNTRT